MRDKGHGHLFTQDWDDRLEEMQFKYYEFVEPEGERWAGDMQPCGHEGCGEHDSAYMIVYHGK